ncbi:single-stranded DNA-binding protein [Caballeronia sp. dw_276]|uniref:single-stranded DNA-binding protein n=1 Tax=Caballeronia sp. dw_276 TaxID=2719795 RepID=UPI001BD202E4|nr:single-stranded DNA-binding protein [Caballeronia sp. dw_276]
MIDALVGGKLFKKPEERRSGSGKSFVVANLNVCATDGEWFFVQVVAFRDTVKTNLLAMDEGDSVSLTGPLKISTYEDRHGTTKPSVSMVAQQVMTAYQVSRKRKAVAEPSDAPMPVHAGVRQAEQLYGKHDVMNESLDDVTF